MGPLSLAMTSDARSSSATSLPQVRPAHEVLRFGNPHRQLFDIAPARDDDVQSQLLQRSH
jgi:hypothetical protein